MALPNEIVIDANILFSFFKSDSSRRHIFRDLLSKGHKLVSPDFVLEEIYNNRNKIKRFCKINEKDFHYIFSILKSNIDVVPKSDYVGFLERASEISPHSKDDFYFALALSRGDPIWSDEEGFKEQSEVEIFSTNYLDNL